MKRMNKVLVLLSMLLVGSSFMSTNNENNAVVAEAAGSNPALVKDWKSIVKNVSSIESLVITADSSKKPANVLNTEGPYDIDDFNGYAFIEAYVYLAAEGNTTRKECYIYTKTGSIYAESGDHLFSGFTTSLKEITFECPFILNQDSDRSASNMFSDNFNLTTINGLNNLDTMQVTDMSYMFSCCYSLKTLDGINQLDTVLVQNMSNMFNYCTSLESLDLSGFDLSSASNLENFISSTSNLKEIRVPNNLSGKTITLPYGFYTDGIAPSMQGTTVLRGSKELNDLVNSLRLLSTCDDYEKGPELQQLYDKLDETDRATFATLRDNADVLLTDKLAYMVYLAGGQSKSATSGKNLVATDIASQSPVLVVLIGCLSLAFIGGYYLAQKRKYAK